MSSLAYWRLYSLEDVNKKARNPLPSFLLPADQQISCWQARWGQAEIRISYGLFAKSCQFEKCDYESLSGGFSLAEKVARVAKDELESWRARGSKAEKLHNLFAAAGPLSMFAFI